MGRLNPVWILSLMTIGLACTEVKERPRLDDETRGPTVQESREVELEVSEDGVIRLSLEAAVMRRYDEPDSVYVLFERGDDREDRVTAAFFDSLGQPSGTLSAEQVRFNEDDHTMIATGDVVVRSDQTVLKSEVVYWYEDQRRIEAPGFASLMTDTENLQGYELEADEDLSHVSIRRPTGTFIVDDQ